jgi:hypothetical protein
MKWELYLTRHEWRELQAAVRERAMKSGEKKPRCEWCGAVHGRLRRNKQGYLSPRWLDTVHVHGRPLKSKNPDDYLALCRSCHMTYDRQPSAMTGLVGRYRDGYAVVTTDKLVEALAGIGCELWGVVDEGWYWRYEGMTGGPEESPALAAAMVVARLGSALGTCRSFLQSAEVAR